MRVALYARVSTTEQQTLPLQIRALRKYARTRGWQIVEEVREIGSGVKHRPGRDRLLGLARRREIDALVVWKLDRWGRSLAELVLALAELQDLGVAFVSLTEALDLTTAAGRAMAGLLGVFAQFEREVMRERTMAGLAEARRRGVRLGRPPSARARRKDVLQLRAEGLTIRPIARRLHISRASVHRLLTAPKKRA